MLDLAFSTRLAVLPVADVDVAVRVDEPSSPVGLVVFPVTLVEATVGPKLIAKSTALHFSFSVRGY